MYGEEPLIYSVIASRDLVIALSLKMWAYHSNVQSSMYNAFRIYGKR